jgi:hypothetical protein
MFAVRNARRLLQLMDDSGDGELNRKEMGLGFRGLGVTLASDQLDALFLLLDRDGSGTLSIGELYLGLRGEMAPQRLKLVNRLHDELAKRAAKVAGQQRGGLGALGLSGAPDDGVAVTFLKAEFSCDHFPAVKSGARRAEDERNLFLSQLDGDLVSPPTGFIGRAKMVDLYQDLSGAFESGTAAGDDYFTFMVRATWNYWYMKIRCQSPPR